MKTELVRLGSGCKAAVGVVAVALALTSCTADATNGDSGSSGSAQDAAAVRAEARVLIDAVSKGTSIEPDSTPRPAAQGITAVLVPNGMNNESSAVNIRGMQDACVAIGWTCTIVDAQSDPSQYAGAMRQAIAQKPNVIVTHGMDCAAVTLPLREAREAGIVTVNSTSYDCSVDGGENLYSATPLYNDPIDPINGQALDYSGYTVGFGKVRGAGIVLGVGDDAPNVIDVAGDEIQMLKDIHDGTMDFVKRVPGAQIHRSDMQIADLGPKLESKVTSELLKYPDANAVSLPFAAAYVAGGGSALKKANRSDLFVMGVEGIPAELDMIRAGIVDASVYSPTAWTGWASIDAANSVLTKTPVVKSGQGWLYVTKDTLPAELGTEPTDRFPDYKAVYTKAWGR